FSAGIARGITAAFRIRILGYSYRGVERLALDLKSRLQRIPRIRNVNVNLGSLEYGGERTRTVRIAPDRDALARFGLTVSQFGGAVAREIRGAAAQQRTEIGGEDVSVLVQNRDSRVQTFDALRDALIPDGLRVSVRIADVAVINEEDAQSVIQREDQQYTR